MTSQIVRKNGVNHIAVNGEIIDSLAFKSFRPTKNNVSDFYKAGVRLFHVYCSGLPSGLKIPYSLYGETWFGEGDYRFENLDKQMDFFIENAPDAYLFVNFHIDVRPWWLEQNPGRPNSFTHLSQIAADEKWRRDTADYLKAAIKHVEEKYGDRVICYFLLGGHTTEWFSDFDYEETHPIKLEAYRKYMGDKDILIPTKEMLEKPKEQLFLDPKADAEVIRYRRFHAELITDLVLFYCREAQKIIDHNKLLGVFFGYIMELKGERMWNSGHLDLERVNESPDIDIIATPSSYDFREYDDCGAYMILGDSVGLYGKTYFASFDNMTFLTPMMADNPRRICNDNDTQMAVKMLSTSFGRTDLLKTREETVHGMRREIMQRLSKRSGSWWFDMLEGWYYDDGLMKEVEHLVNKSKALLDKPRKSCSEIAVFVSCEALYYVNKKSDINTELICKQRGGLGKMGAPYDLYSIDDIDKVDPDRYKLFIFTDAFYLKDTHRDYINNVVKKNGRSLLFISLCDYSDDSGISLERTTALTEMNIELLDISEAKVNAFGTSYGYDSPKTPTPYVCDSKANSLGEFSESKKCALAIKDLGDYKVFYSAVGNLSSGVLREVARTSGVHIYAEGGVPVYVNSGFAGVYNTHDSETVITLPYDGEFEELFSGKKYKTENRRVVLPTGECPAQMLVL